MHRVLKVAPQPWPTLADAGVLVGYVMGRKVDGAYFRADHFCRRDHDNIETRRQFRQAAIDQISPMATQSSGLFLYTDAKCRCVNCHSQNRQSH